MLLSFLNQDWIVLTIMFFVFKIFWVFIEPISHNLFFFSIVYLKAPSLYACLAHCNSFASPRNDCKVGIFVGAGIFLIAPVFDGSGVRPFASIICSHNLYYSWEIGISPRCVWNRIPKFSGIFIEMFWTLSPSFTFLSNVVQICNDKDLSAN